MIRSRIINIFSMITSIVIFILFFVGLYLQLFSAVSFGDLPKYITSGALIENCKSLALNFGFLNAVVCFIAAFLMFFIYPRSIKKGRNCAPFVFKTIRYIAATMSVICLFGSLVILGPAFTMNEIFVTGNAEIKDLLFVNYSAVVFRLAIPVLSLIQYLVLEVEQTRNFRISFIPYAFVVAYGVMVTIYISVLAKSDMASAAATAPYYFFLYSEELIAASQFANYLTIVRTISMFVIMALISFVLGALIWLGNKYLGVLMFGYEYIEVDEANRVIKPIHTLQFNEVYKKAKIEYTDTETGAVKKATTEKLYGGSKAVKASLVYHVSVYSSKLNNWKISVTGKKNTKLLKVFPTCQEATKYAQMLAKKDNGIVRIHTSNEKKKKK